MTRLALIFSLLYQMFYERRGAVGEGVNEGVNALVELIKQRQGMRVPALAELMNTSPKNLERWLKQLRDAGQIEFIGSSKTGGYYPKQ
ncbi:MAG: hypothetical protein WCI64_07585 [Chlorobium sp.]